MELTVLNYEIIENVGVIKMNNPPVNALGPIFLDDFNQVLTDSKNNSKVRALLLTSACKGIFSAGDDVKQLEDVADELIAILPKVHLLLKELEILPLPTVASINGYALGGGLELALPFDFRFMGSDSGQIGMPEIRLGLLPTIGGTQYLQQFVGRAKAIEMLIKGRIFNPEEAKHIGLVNDVFPQEELYEKSFDFARRLAKQATGAIARIKSCMSIGLRQGFEKGMAREIETFKENIFSPDAKEGIDAFLNNRKPVFKG